MQWVSARFEKMEEAVVSWFVRGRREEEEKGVKWAGLRR